MVHMVTPVKPSASQWTRAERSHVSSTRDRPALCRLVL